MTDRQHDKPVDGASLDNLWDFGDPAGSEARFREHLGHVHPDGTDAGKLATQLARALGLQGRFAEANAVLDGIDRRHPVVHAQLGPLLNVEGKGVSSGAPCRPEDPGGAGGHKVLPYRIVASVSDSGRASFTSRSRLAAAAAPMASTL